MQIASLEIPEIRLITPAVHKDPRGSFAETYNRRALAEHGIDLQFVQDNHSISVEPGTIRGFHFQVPPFEQAKLVRCTKGSILDVAVDIRRGSPTFGRYVSIKLDAETWTQILIPVGFAHAFCTLEPDTEVVYKVTKNYSAGHDVGFRWNDPDIGVDWPVADSEAKLSDKDHGLPLFRDLDNPFQYQANAND